MPEIPVKTVKSRGLGRGLSALLSDVTAEGDATDRPRRPDLRIPVERLHPNPLQPRRAFPPEALAELAASISARGIIQPLIVRPHPTRPDDYEIVATSSVALPGFTVIGEVVAGRGVDVRFNGTSIDPGPGGWRHG